MYKTVLACVIALFVCAASSQPTTLPKQPRLTGGNTVPNDQLTNYNYIGGVITTTGKICGGFIINPTHVLTAAHCVDTASKSIGSLKAKMNGANSRESTVAEIIYHPDYSKSTLANDLAIVRLNGGLDGSGTLNLRTSTVPDGETCRIASLDITTASLKYLDVKIEPRANCANIKDEQICSRPRVTCDTDLGYPLVNNNELVGISVSECTDPNIVYSAYLDVSKYAEWIKANSKAATNLISRFALLSVVVAIFKLRF